MSLPVLFFAPHQDDETLLMGVEIVRHVMAGRPAIVICAGDGTTSGALPAPNGNPLSHLTRITSRWDKASRRLERRHGATVTDAER